MNHARCAPGQARLLLAAMGLVLTLLLLGLAPAVVHAAPADHLVLHTSFVPKSPTILSPSRNMTISFNYKTAQVAGVRIFARPLTGAALPPKYAASPSPLYPAGSGSGSGTFTVTSGDAVVTSVRIQMWNDAQTTLLFETFVPVSYQFRSATQKVTKLTTTSTPNVLKRGQKVKVGFDYKIVATGGARIFVRPITAGELTPHYAAHASPLYPKGTGTANGWFTVTSGTTTVDHVQIEMWNAAGTKRLFQAFVPVSYRFVRTANVVTSFSFSLPSANILELDELLNINFKYTTNYPGGVRIWLRPTAGNYGAHPSSLYPVGSGVGNGWFTIENPATTVSGISVEMWDDAATVLIFRAVMPVSYQFR